MHRRPYGGNIIFRATPIRGMSVYVGSNALMISSQQLFKLPFLHYWRAGGFILPVETIGYQMIQQIAGEKIFGVGIDRDTTQTDRLVSGFRSSYAHFACVSSVRRQKR